MRTLHKAMQNEQLLAQIAILLAKYKNIEGAARSTLIGGVAQFMLGSGIFSDAYSVTDAQKIKQRVGYESEINVYAEDYDEQLDTWQNAVDDMTDLQCNNLLAEINDLSEQYDDGSLDNTGCSYLAEDIISKLEELETAQLA